MVTGGNRRIDRILAPHYLDGVEHAPFDRVRDMRDECAEEEAVLSYERSLIHTRLRLLNAEQEQRRSGGTTRSLIERLPEILADDEVKHRGSFPNLQPPPIYENPRRRVEKLVNNDTLARLPELSDEEIREAKAALEDAERGVSETRKSIHTVLDRLIEEIARRKAGADV